MRLHIQIQPQIQPHRPTFVFFVAGSQQAPTQTPTHNTRAHHWHQEGNFIGNWLLRTRVPRSSVAARGFVHWPLQRKPFNGLV